MTSSAGHGPWRVLVVDDEENLNWSLVNSLRKDGYVADGALTGEDAQAQLAQTRYDCVVSDVKMPGMDGFELLQWLRQHQPRTRVIMMTAFGSPSARQDALRDGVIAYLEKPFDLRLLKDELRRMAAREGGVPAEPDAYDLIEVARVISLSRRDMALLVRAGAISGRLRFARGELIWAEAGQERGDEAFLLLCGPRGSRIQQEPWDGWTERNVTQPIAQLIFSALLRRDARPTGGPTVLPSQAGMAGRAGAPLTAPLPVAYLTGGLPPVQPSAVAMPIPPPPPAVPVSSTSGPAVAAGGTTESLSARTMPPAIESVPPEAAPDSPVGAALGALLEALPHPCGIVLLRADAGAVLAHRWSGRAAIATATYTHLGAAMQAAARALLLADLGMLEDAGLTTADHLLLLVRHGRADRAGLLLAILPHDADRAQVTQTLRDAAAGLLAALR
ncbi:MAG TPA: response regulator [Ktedonobacterales bacterium]|nr:response regulator [Ktedonobacterales bacterium]